MPCLLPKKSWTDWEIEKPSLNYTNLATAANMGSTNESQQSTQEEFSTPNSPVGSVLVRSLLFSVKLRYLMETGAGLWAQQRILHL